MIETYTQVTNVERIYRPTKMETFSQVFTLVLCTYSTPIKVCSTLNLLHHPLEYVNYCKCSRYERECVRDFEVEHRYLHPGPHYKQEIKASDLFYPNSTLSSMLGGRGW